jgi:4-deoxy-L-threo-5-hexosulose-uronate ketol-isomerase
MKKSIILRKRLHKKAMISRYAIDPATYQRFDTGQLREAFLVEHIFRDDQVSAVYTHYDRLIVGGVKPTSKEISLDVYDHLKADFFLQRREVGIINVGAKGEVLVDGSQFALDNKDALYIGRGAKQVVFSSTDKEPALFYFNSAPAHTTYPSKKITLEEAETV